MTVASVTTAKTYSELDYELSNNDALLSAVFTCTFADLYEATGVACDFTDGTTDDHDFGTVYYVSVSTNDGYVIEYDLANEVFLFYWCDYDAVADGALMALTATTDITNVVATVHVLGTRA